MTYFSAFSEKNTGPGNHIGSLSAVAGVAAAVERPLDQLPADPDLFRAGAVADAHHLECLLDTLERFNSAVAAQIVPGEISL
jgi:hypothetical protein